MVLHYSYHFYAIISPLCQRYGGRITIVWVCVTHITRLLFNHFRKHYIVLPRCSLQWNVAWMYCYGWIMWFLCFLINHSKASRFCVNILLCKSWKPLGLDCKLCIIDGWFVLLMLRGCSKCWVLVPACLVMRICAHTSHSSAVSHISKAFLHSVTVDINSYECKL